MATFENAPPAGRSSALAAFDNQLPRSRAVGAVSFDNGPAARRPAAVAAFDNQLPRSRLVGSLSFDNGPAAGRTAAGVVFDNQLPRMIGGGDVALFSDSFGDGTDGQPLAAPWEAPVGFGTALQYLNGRARSSGGPPYLSRVSNVALVDGYLQVKTYAEPEMWNSWSLLARISQASPFRYYKATLLQYDKRVILTCLSQTNRSVASVEGIEMVEGALLRLELIGRVLTVKYNGVTVLNAVDSHADALMASGTPGMGAFTTYGQFDDFECGLLPPSTFVGSPPAAISLNL